MFPISDNDTRNIESAILKQKYKMICINDEYSGDNFEGTRDRIINAFENILPEISSFEK